MLDATDLARRRPARILARLVREHGEQTSVTRIEIQVILVGLAEIGLLHHERHAEHALPEINRTLARGSDDRRVMDALDLNLLHANAPSAPSGPDVSGPVLIAGQTTRCTTRAACPSSRASELYSEWFGRR